MSDIVTSVKIPQIPMVIPSVIDISSTKSSDEIGSRSCPLCRSEVRLFFINFNDKMLMCENPECEFPFGYEELVFVKVADEIESHVEIDASSVRTKVTQDTPSCSVVSAACWSEIEKMSRVYDSEDSQAFEPKALEPKEYISLNILKKRAIEPIKECSITKTLNEIKKLNADIDEKPDIVIKNETFLKNLLSLQKKKSHNAVVLKAKEIQFIKKETPAVSSAVTVDIKSEKGSMSSININITDVKQDEPDSEMTGDSPM